MRFLVDRCACDVPKSTSQAVNESKMASEFIYWIPAFAGMTVVKLERW